MYKAIPKINMYVCIVCMVAHTYKYVHTYKYTNIPLLRMVSARKFCERSSSKYTWVVGLKGAVNNQSSIKDQVGTVDSSEHIRVHLPLMQVQHGLQRKEHRQPWGECCSVIYLTMNTTSKGVVCRESCTALCSAAR